VTVSSVPVMNFLIGEVMVVNEKWFMVVLHRAELYL